MFICDSTVLINFAAIDRLDVLQACFEKLLIPNAVYAETIGANFRDWQRLTQAVSGGWIEVHPILPSQTDPEIPLELSEGERETIILGLELDDAQLLLDEHPARQVAKQLNLKVLGTLGILLFAKKQQIIPQVQPLLDRLLDQAHYWFSSELYQEMLKQAQE
jgi:predicted nucleic acid-binding protein